MYENCELSFSAQHNLKKTARIMPFLVALLNKNKMIVVKKEWVFHPAPGRITRVFYSPLDSDIASLSSPLLKVFEDGVAAWYDAYLLMDFGKFN